MSALDTRKSKRAGSRGETHNRINLGALTTLLEGVSQLQANNSEDWIVLSHPDIFDYEA